MTKSEYIIKLPDNVYEIITSHYWWDAINQQLIIKDKRNNKYKIVKPMSDKWHDGLFYHLFDNDGNKIYVNHEYLIFCYSPAYYLNQLLK